MAVVVVKVGTSDGREMVRLLGGRLPSTPLLLLGEEEDCPGMIMELFIFFEA